LTVISPKINIKMSKKVILAFSGGLDTSYCAKYLSETLGYDVYAVTVNTGGFSTEEEKELERKAFALGVKEYKCIDARQDYYNSCVKYLIFGNVLKNNTYPLSVSAERTVQAQEIAKYAIETAADAIAHGSTGAGNDQVRFDLIFRVLCPDVEIITPIRDLALSREEEIMFLKSHGYKMDFGKAQYSVNKGLWGTSVGGKETLTSDSYLPEEAFPSQIKKTHPSELEIEFKKGEVVTVNGHHFEHSVEAIQKIEELASAYGIGRDIHVGDTIVGIKGRVGFEAAAASVIIKAHHLLEKHTLSKYQQMMKSQLSDWYGNWLHEALFLDPVMRNIESFLMDSQETVSGKVFITLHPYWFVLKGIESKHDLMSDQFGSYGEENRAWTGEDVKGYTKILSNSLYIYHQINT
jgi:argininosuccinate synthase